MFRYDKVDIERDLMADQTVEQRHRKHRVT